MARRPMLSGHCLAPTPNVEEPHGKCLAGNAANPDKEWVPCPCDCHLGDEFVCGCGRPIREAPHWREFEEDEDMVYVHVDPRANRAVGEECA